jgi:hypothetical protein
MAENSSVTLLQRVRTASNATTGWSLVQTSGRRSRSQLGVIRPLRLALPLLDAGQLLDPVRLRTLDVDFGPLCLSIVEL